MLSHANFEKTENCKHKTNTPYEVIMLLKGIDFFCAYEPLKYE